MEDQLLGTRYSADYFMDCFNDCGTIEALQIFSEDIAENNSVYSGASPHIDVTFKDGSRCVYHF